MTEHDEAFSERTIARRQEIADGAVELPLRIAVLGPNLDDSENIGTRKRRQIAYTLAADGHETFFPEQVMDDPLVLWIDQERRVLSSDDVDLVIILHTESSAGALMEIANFASVSAIRVKTGILFPFRFYTPEQSLPGNTVQAYTTKMLYTEEDLESCQLVTECRQWAVNRQRDLSPRFRPESF